MEEQERKFISETVHRLYWDHDINCARTMLSCLGVLLDTPIEEQTMLSAIGMHGAGGFGAQCGLVEGALMFIGIYGAEQGHDDKLIASCCFDFAKVFTAKFGALRCCELRPGGFTDHDSPHLCEELTNETIVFTTEYLRAAAETGTKKLPVE